MGNARLPFALASIEEGEGRQKGTAQGMPAISRRNGMDPAIFEVFAAQQDRCVRDRLIPAEAEVVETDAVPPAILDEMRAMGLFGITVPVSHGGAGLNGWHYVKTIRQLAHAHAGADDRQGRPQDGPVRRADRRHHPGD